MPLAPPVMTTERIPTPSPSRNGRGEAMRRLSRHPHCSSLIASSLSDDVFAAVHADHVAGHPTGARAGEGDERTRDIFRCRQTAAGIDALGVLDELVVAGNLP